MVSAICSPLLPSLSNSNSACLSYSKAHVLASKFFLLRLRKPLGNRAADLLLDTGVIPESGKPDNPGFFSEPRYLPFAVLPRGSLRVADGVAQADFPQQGIERLAVSVRLQRRRGGRAASR